MILIEENKLIAYTGSEEEQLVLPQGIQNISAGAFCGHRNSGV